MISCDECAAAVYFGEQVSIVVHVPIKDRPPLKVVGSKSLCAACVKRNPTIVSAVAELRSSEASATPKG